MSRITAAGSPASGGWLGILAAWLRPRSNETPQSSRELPCEAAAPMAHDHGSVQVLVADDNPVNLMVISALLQSRGLVPLLAADGAEAVALACGLKLDLVLMDLQMPILDGLDATAAIRRFETDHSRPAVPVVAYSSSLPAAGVLTAHGMNGSLVKPCDDRDLEDCLVRWCPAYHPDSSRRSAASGNPRSHRPQHPAHDR